MGIIDRFRGVGPGGYRARSAERLELAGDLEGAARTFLDAEMFDDAARVLLLRADAEVLVDKRMAFCQKAASIARDKQIAKTALARKARLRFDIVKERQGALLKSEMLLAGKELEEADENEVAAEAYALAGDEEGEVRALTAAGLIDRLEEKLRISQASAKSDNDVALAQKRVVDLDRVGERRAALALAKTTRDQGTADDRVETAARSIRAKLCRGPICELKIRGVVRRYALGKGVTIGRGEATIVAQSTALSRVHLRIGRTADGVTIEDCATRNGTFLAGARLSRPIPVGEGVSLRLGGEIPCTVRPAEAGAVQVDIGGRAYFAPLGPLSLEGREIDLDGDGFNDDSFVVFRTTPALPAFLGEYQLGPIVELAAHDAPSTARGGPPLFTVLPTEGVS